MRFGKFRPQVLTALVALGILAAIAMYLDRLVVAGAATAGIIALAKDMLDSGDGSPPGLG